MCMEGGFLSVENYQRFSPFLVYCSFFSSPVFARCYDQSVDVQTTVSCAPPECLRSGHLLSRQLPADGLFSMVTFCCALLDLLFKIMIVFLSLLADDFFLLFSEVLDLILLT